MSDKMIRLPSPKIIRQRWVLAEFADQLRAERDTLAEKLRVAEEALEGLRRTEHTEHEDQWYSCPLSDEGCANESDEGCTCGLEVWNEKIDNALARIREEATND